jgi:hypothetical protein
MYFDKVWSCGRYTNADIAKIALKKFEGHLWYLSEELIALAFFDDEVPLDTKCKMVSALDTPGIDNPLKRTIVDMTAIQSKELENFVSSNTRRFFEITGLPFDFVTKDPSEWEQEPTYKAAKAAAQCLRVVNDIAERGVALMDEYNTLHTNNEEQKQFLLLVVKNYRQNHPDRNKSTLMQ